MQAHSSDSIDTDVCSLMKYHFVKTGASGYEYHVNNIVLSFCLSLHMLLLFELKASCLAQTDVFMRRI